MEAHGEKIRNGTRLERVREAPAPACRRRFFSAWKRSGRKKNQRGLGGVEVGPGCNNETRLLAHPVERAFGARVRRRACAFLERKTAGSDGRSGEARAVARRSFYVRGDCGVHMRALHTWNGESYNVGYPTLALAFAGLSPFRWVHGIGLDHCWGNVDNPLNDLWTSCWEAAFCLPRARRTSQSLGRSVRRLWSSEEEQEPEPSPVA